MDKLDLERFEKRLRLRRTRPQDFGDIVAIGQRCFPGMEPWTLEHIESQLHIFPEGQMSIEVDGTLAASCSTLVVASVDYAEDWHDWAKVSDDGFIRNHDPEGDVLYGIEIQVDPAFRGIRLARRLYDARKELACRLNLRSIIIGGRIPGYGEHAHRLTARAYVDEVIAKQLHDPVLTTQLANGFVLKRLIPNYLPSDEASCGYATFLEWPNLDYQQPNRRRFARAVEPVRLAVVQYEVRPVESFKAFAQQAEFFVDVAADKSADFILFPELFTTQLLSVRASKRAEEGARMVSEYTESYLELLANLAVRYNINIVGGSQFTVEDERLYNVAYLFRRNGTLEKQYKLHITGDERRWWGLQGGNEIHTFLTDRGKVAILVGYDVQFPELGRLVAEAGARLVFVPFTAGDRAEYLTYRICARARAVENHVYVVTSGVVGNLPFVDNADVHYAVSGIYTPSDVSFARDGIAAETTPNIEAVLVQDLDMELLRRHQQTGTFRNLLDRRHDVYLMTTAKR
ncbi:MAG: carbon-nitrogen hydrolase [Myxococcales bacterium]|nr:carbon-nitrogen hydrolase [Myxococcales bacterium]